MTQIPVNRNIAVLAAIMLILSSAPGYAGSKKTALTRSPHYEAIPIKIAQKIPLPEGYHEGLFPDGTNMWVANGEGGKTWVIDTISGKLTGTIEPVAGFTEAVSRILRNLFFVTDWDEKKLYKARLNNNRLDPESWVSVSPAHPAGVVWTGERLFVITWTRGMGTRFDLLELDKGMKLKETVSIQKIEEPAHLAWDGKNLWITSWYDSLVYKVDVGKWEILGSFKSPVSRTTGIAWDGRYLWLTGTYSDLYKLEVAK